MHPAPSGIRPRYIRSASNVWADKLSREMDKGDWRLRPILFQLLDERWGLHTIDRFATANNHQLPKFNSQFCDPLSSGVDALAQSDQDWRQENNWVNPPWELLDDVVAKLRNSGGAATVIAPDWPDRAWYQRLLELSSEIVTMPRHHNMFYPGRLGSSVAIGPSSWNAVAFRVPALPAGVTHRAEASLRLSPVLPRLRLDLHAMRLLRQ